MANKTQGRRICVYLPEELYVSFQKELKLIQKKNQGFTESKFGIFLIKKTLADGIDFLKITF